MTAARLALLVLVAILVLVTNVAASVLYMVVYSYLIDPGHEAKFYEDHIQIAAPYCSIVAGLPLMFAAGWWVARWWRGELGMRAAWTVWLVYFLIDLAIVSAVGASLGVWALFVVSFSTKLAAVLLGARWSLGALARASSS